MAGVHDEFIDDSFYSTGWSEVSTSSQCSNGECECRGSGSCVSSVFNHFMYITEGASSDTQPSRYTFPLFVDKTSVDEVSVEEVKCREYITGSAFRYYDQCVVKDRRTQTMVSVCTGEYKSTCFDIPCLVLRVKRDCVTVGCVIIEECQDGTVWIVATRDSVTSQLMEALVVVGVEPIVSKSKCFTILLKLCPGLNVRMRVTASGMRVPRGCALSVVGSPQQEDTTRLVSEVTKSVEAVRTARVTVSIVLTPRSLYGGKNPSTKIVEYFVHNVKYE